MEGKEEARARLNKEAKEEERKSGKREVEGERARVEIKRICLDRVSGKAFEVFCPNSEMESVGDSLGPSVSVPFVSLVVLCGDCSFLGCECKCGLRGCFLRLGLCTCGAADSFSKKTRSKCGLESETEITMEVENVNPPWTARERLLIAKMEKYLEESEQIQVEISELEHFLLGPEEADVSITSFAENGRDGGGWRRL